MTMPGLLDDALAAAGATTADVGLTMRRLDPAYRAVYADGSQIRVRDSTEATRAEILATCGPRDAAFDRFVPWLERLYRIEMEPFIARNYDSVLGLLARPGAAVGLLREGGLGRLGSAVGRYFDDDRLARLFSFQALYAGVAPADARAMFAVITYMDSIAGVYYPQGGMRAIPLAMGRALERAGATMHLGAEVSAILRRGDLERSPASSSPAATGSQPTPSCAPWTCRSLSDGCCPTCRCRAPGPRHLFAVGGRLARRRRGECPAQTSGTTTSTSATTGTAHSRRSSTAVSSCPAPRGW